MTFGTIAPDNPIKILNQFFFFHDDEKAVNNHIGSRVSQ